MIAVRPQFDPGYNIYNTHTALLKLDSSFFCHGMPHVSMWVCNLLRIRNVKRFIMAFYLFLFIFNHKKKIEKIEFEFNAYK